MALALAQGVLGDLREKGVLVVGTGKIGVQTLEAVSRRKIRRVAVANRTVDRATDLATRFDATAYGLDELETALAAADIAITATAAESAVVTGDAVRAAMSGRRDRPLVIVDLAVPADVERSAAAVPGVRLFDVDDLRAGLDEALTSRLREVPKVEAIIEEEVQEFGRRYRELAVAPLLSALHKQAEALRQRELDRALGDLGDVDPQVVARMDHLTRSLVTKLLHDPTIRLREQAGTGDAEQVAETVRELFGINAPQDQ
jgi:glutamyl-tRNA reductase